MDRISVIVPVYKVESYLPSCIESVLSQTYPCFELILVDDGSPDHCGEICDAYARKDDRVRVIHQKNAGLSAARNAGLEIVSGAYVTFVDSDDAIHPQMLERLIKAIQTTDANMSLCFFTRAEADLAVQVKSKTPEMISGEEACLRIYGIKNGTQISSEESANYVIACCKLFPTEMFAELRFPVGKKHEDEFTTYRLLYEAGSIAVLSDPLYYYRPNPGSIMAHRGIAEKKNYIEALCERSDYYQSVCADTLLGKTQGALSFATTEYALLARREKQKNDLPKRLRVPVLIALRRMKHNCSRERFAQYLEMVSPSAAKLYKRLYCKH